MSTQEHIYLMTELSPEALAVQIAPLAGLEIRHGRRDQLILVRAARLGPGEVGGELYRNAVETDWRTNAERSFIDAFPIVLDVGYTGRDEEIQRAEARLLFGELSAAPILTALVQSLDLLLAVSHPEFGMIMMPEGTTPDDEHRDLWLPYLPVGKNPS
ncbi:hypothetical protein [Actinoplanes sp. NPDC089786]|uniref:hypothetical protein n=1 Tax=Actinoplanes sp. NPDC089786 TaxID=3155185 RepID=UPI003445057E